MVRQKKRYFVIHVDTDENPYAKTKKFTFHSLNETILKHITELYGDFGIAAIQGSFIAKYVNQQTQIAIIKAPHGPHKMVACVLPLIKKLDSVQVQCRTLYTGATIKNCFNFLIQYQQRKLEEFIINLKSKEDVEELKKILHVDLKNFY